LLIDSRSALWAFSRLVRGPQALRSVAGLKMAKVLGSGREGGFGLAPSATHQGLFCVFDGQDRAADFLADSAIVAAYRRHAREFCSVLLRPTSSRGSWDGLSLSVAAVDGSSAQADPSRPVAALTRASIKAVRAWDFWRMTPAAQRSLEHAEGCRLSVGLGEAPLLRQATFSIWDSTAAMAAYARQGAHQAAILASLNGQHFSESMFVRFDVLQIRGHWKGLHHG
jgi:spheroidene monooxygenase